MPMIRSTEYEKYNATTVPLLCSISGQNLLYIQHVTEKVAGIFITTDTQLCQKSVQCATHYAEICMIAMKGLEFHLTYTYTGNNASNADIKSKCI